ncbi:MAG: TlpA family protein disulfide reductase [Acidobacteriota bacterium]
MWCVSLAWWTLIFLLVGAFWFAFRKSGIAPKLILLLVAPFLLVLALVTLKGPGPVPGLPGGGAGNWLKPDERSAIDLSGEFRNLDGHSVSLSDFAGRVLFLNVWATWCGPCRQEMPSMAELYREFSGQGLAMVAVSSEDLDTVRDYAGSGRYPFTILVDSEDTLSQRFGINAIPTTFIVDKQGQLVYQHVGFNDWSSPAVREQIRGLLTNE